MPRPRPEQCVYKDSGRRCTKNGTGDPPLCRAHAVAFADAARRFESQRADGQPFGSGIADVLSSFLNGAKVRADSLQQAAFEIFVGIGMAGRFTPPEGFQPPPGWMPPGGRRPSAPPPPDPKELARKRARTVLGFGAEHLTVDMIKERRRKMALRVHPDRGGSAAKMAEVNHAADVLLEAVSA